MGTKRRAPPTYRRAGDGPGWLPVATRNYLAHVEGGQTIRELAKASQVHPSTILRRVRRVEALREDPLLDAALKRLAVQQPEVPEPAGIAALVRAAMPVLQQLAETGAILAIARDMEMGVVAREVPSGEPQRLGLVERALAEDMALRGWIVCLSPDARMQRYRIAASGRALLRGSGVSLARSGFSEAATAFAAAPDAALGPDDDERLHHMRSTLPETPLLSLSRRRDEKGEPFLSREDLAAGERLREDYELSQAQEEVPVDWAQALEWLPILPGPASGPAPKRVSSATERLERALREMGPGMADVLLRCCCLLEGLEVVERRLGWSARSGKVVLRIALGRLQQHYRAEDARTKPLIG